MPWDTSSVPCGAGVAARFLLGRCKRKWQLVNSLVLFTLHPAPFLVLSCLSLSALPIFTPGLQKKRALPCRLLLTVFYLCTPFSWIKNNSFSQLVFTCSQDLYLKWSKAQAWLKLTKRGEPFFQVGNGRVAGNSASCPAHRPSQKQAADLPWSKRFPCHVLFPSSRMNLCYLQLLLQSPCKMTARALPGLILVLLKGQGCAAYSDLHYMGATGQQQP